jgi:tripartite-type tricarboxylate transporter receptor subunit TctC
MLRASVILAAVLAMNSIAANDASAELLSSRPITIIIPFTPGASADTLQRIVGKKVTENTGQILVMESRAGGGGAIGAAVVKQALPDGHTLFQANAGTHAANQALYATLPYDPIKDFRPITLMWSFPQLLAVPLDSPAKSVSELVALAKSKPGGLSFASQGTGSGGHLLGEMLKARTGANMVHIPYRGAGPAALDLAAGRVDFFFVSYSSALSFLQAGKVRVLAVTSPKRLPALPDAPTMREVGFAGIELDAWFGLVAPAGTTDPVIGKLNAAFVQAVRDPEVVKQMIEQGAEPAANATTPDEFATFIASETERFGQIVKAVGVKGE